MQYVAFAAAFASAVAASPIENLEKRDTPKTLIDPAVFQDLVRYGGYDISAGTQPCPTNTPYGSVVEGYVNINATDTQATIYRQDSTSEVILAIPGTASTQDFITDFEFIPFLYTGPNATQCVGCLVHSGFQGAWQSASSAAKSIVAASLKAHPGYKLTVTGYSLGGALAHLAYLDLIGSNFNVSNVYTFGQPRVGNPPFADFTDKMSGASATSAGIYHRVTHDKDGVPQLPPQLLGFKHCSSEYWERNATTNGEPTAASTYRCYGQEPSDCSNSVALPGFNADHTTYAGFAAARSYCH